MIWFNNGIPDDAEGSFYHYPAATTATHPVHGLYRHLKIAFAIDGVSIIYNRTYDQQFKFWGGRASRDVGPAIEFCNGGGTWGPQAHFEVDSTVGLSCNSALAVVGSNPVQPKNSLFVPGADVFVIGGCHRYRLDLQDVSPPAYATGSGMAECTQGAHGFDTLFRD